MTRDGPQTRVSPPDTLLKGLLGERATGCWELELNGLGKSETHTGGRKERGGRDYSALMAHSIFSPANKAIFYQRRNTFTEINCKMIKLHLTSIILTFFIDNHAYKYI